MCGLGIRLSGENLDRYLPWFLGLREQKLGEPTCKYCCMPAAINGSPERSGDEFILNKKVRDLLTGGSDEEPD